MVNVLTKNVNNQVLILDAIAAQEYRILPPHLHLLLPHFQHLKHVQMELLLVNALRQSQQNAIRMELSHHISLMIVEHADVLRISIVIYLVANAHQGLPIMKIVYLIHQQLTDAV